jgi:uncharacterized membrane protein
MNQTLPLVQVQVLDAVALAAWLTCWCGYAVFADRLRRGSRNLMTVMHLYRLKWMERMLEREVRIGDTNILSTLNRSAGLFASTSVFIVAGLLTLLGALDEAALLSRRLVFVAEAPAVVWEVRVLTLVLVFVYAFFKFIWALRQFNVGLQVMGAAPEHSDLQSPDRSAFARITSRVISLGTDTFNAGVRAYYFGLAMLSWFIHPGLFIAASVWVVLVLYRREFRSKTLATLTTGLRDAG